MKGVRMINGMGVDWVVALPWIVMKKFLDEKVLDIVDEENEDEETPLDSLF